MTVWAGSFGDKKGLPPPPHSYATSNANDVAVLFIELPPGAKITLPAARGGPVVNRVLYFVEGKRASIGTDSVTSGSAITIKADADAEISNTHAEANAEFLLLQGKPIDERVVQHGPFVMNSEAEIQQAFADYRKTQFGGWPWPQDAMCFPRAKPRFALQKGVEMYPPSGSQSLSD